MVKIYTKGGDKGQSSLFDGERRPKIDPIFEALGALDELNVEVGFARHFCEDHRLDRTDPDPFVARTLLATVQCRLLDIGTIVATPSGQPLTFDPQLTLDLEKWIDYMTDRLPPLTNFILPGGGLASLHIHRARVKCRRAERKVLATVNEDSRLPMTVRQYLNRLGDFLFTLARWESTSEDAVYKTDQTVNREKRGVVKPSVSSPPRQEV